ncbi:ceramide-1-phosphate transfer protein-like isoform X2 [Pomacea canaliculata]|nr:ceramide-1-phosphate transfer protein-like isoform X2 [Pomacea canaliculata]
MAEFRSDKKHDFDLEVVLDAFRKCILPDGSLSLDEYLRAFHELCRFFHLTGRLFGFVAKDLEGKMKAIEARKAADMESHYITLQSMMQYEIREGMVRARGQHASGTRQFLRLHYALEFILEFMRQLRCSDEHARTSHIASEVYSRTLSKHHPWITRKLAALAVHMLPSKKHLIDVMCKHDYNSVQTLIDDVTAEGNRIYDIAQRAYENNNLAYSVTIISFILSNHLNNHHHYALHHRHICDIFYVPQMLNCRLDVLRSFYWLTRFQLSFCTLQ